MINSVADLKNRTLVESNILKSFILSQIGGVKSPDRDDILIHDYQIANSVTINSILSNYIVNLKYAWDLYDNLDQTSSEKYFKIVQKLDDEAIAALPDETRLILDVSDGAGTFKSRKLRFAIKPVAITAGTRKFVNLDTVWYGVVDKHGEDGSEWDEIEIVDDMNDFYVNPNPFGGDINPFACSLYSGSSVRWSSFNKLLSVSKTRVNCIVENLFRNNKMFSDSVLGPAIVKCQYIVCTTHRLYGLIPKKNASGAFLGFELVDIGSLVNNIDQDQYRENQFEFNLCGFNVVSDTCTFFLVFSDSIGYHYAYFNEGTYDQTYGFTAMKTIAVDQLIVDVKDVFRSVESIKTLDSVTIVLTDYGFWDIEPNETDYITYSYRGGEKKHSVIDGEYQARGDKVVLPTIVVGETDRVVEYDKVWKLSGKKYAYGGSGTGKSMSYMRDLVGEDGEIHGFVGGTDTFAIYNGVSSGTDNYPAYILTQISLEQFNSLLFSTPGLVTPFFKWLYGKIVQQAVAGVHGGEGEYYLWDNNSSITQKLYDIQNNELSQGGRFRRFRNYSFQIPRTGSSDPLEAQEAQLIGSKFSSIYDIAGRPADLYSFCTYLHNLGSGSIGWLFSKASDSEALASLRNCMFGRFKVDYQSKVDSLVESVLDELTQTDGYPLLSYFRKCLRDKLLADMAGNRLTQGQTRIMEDSQYVDKAAADVVQYIKNNTVTASILGDPSHEGIQSYLYQNRMLLNRFDVLAIMSPSNALTEMTLAVQSMPFFKEHTDYQKLMSNKDRDDLFTIRQNVEFASKSGLAGDDGSLAVDWDQVKNWIFGAEVTEESLVKAFMRTQFYRPLFFKADNYDMFTEDETLYKCETDRFYVNHNGAEHELVLGDNGLVDFERSGLTREKMGGNCEVTSATYLNTNFLKYSLKYDEVSVVGNKFVLEDMEFFVLRPVAESNEVNSVCFNEFQKATQPSNDQLEIVDNRFTLNGVEYEIEGGTVVSVDSATTVFDEQLDEADTAKFKEFKGEIVKDEVDRIQIDGVQYVLEKDGSEYRWLKYADIDDNRLAEVLIDHSGYGYYEPLNLHIQFNSAWDKVNIVKDYQIQVINRLRNEWCFFDSKPVEFGEKRSYDWYLANEIQWMMDNYPQKAAGIDLLGHGVLYSGGLMNASYVLEVESEMRNGYAMTKGVLVKTMPGTGEVVRQDIGTLFNGSLVVDQNKVFVGKIEDNLVEKDSDNGDMTIILKNSSEKLNNCNAVWMSKTPVDSWKNAWSLQSVGMAVPYEDEDGGEGDTFENEDASLSSLKIEFDLNLESSPDFVVLDPVIEVDQNDSTNKQVSKYRVRIREDGIGTFDAVKINDYVHIVVDGERYRINTSTMDVEKFMFNPIEVKTMDFSTQYTASRLRENLLSNIKQYMMNQLVEKLILHPFTGGTGSSVSNGEITMVPRSIDKYIDLFPIDVEKESFSSVMAVDLDSKEASKFVETYSSNMRDIDDSHINSGNAYKFLEEKVRAAFSDGQSYQSVLLVSDEHSIDVTRVDHADKFTYRIHFDLHLRASKKILESIEDQDVKGKYIIGNAVLEDIVCEARFIPTYAYPQSQSDLSKSMKYKVQYQIVEGDYQGYYDQIIYAIEEKARVKTIDPRAISTHLSVPAYPAQFQQNELDNITDELAESQIQKMITDAIVRSIVVIVNNSLQESQRPTTQVQYNILQNEIYPAVNGVWQLYNDAPDEAIFKDEGRATIDGTIYNVVREGDGYILQEDGGDARLDIINRIANGTKTIQSHDSITGGIKDVVLAVSSQPVVSQADIASAFEFGTYELTTFKTPEDGGSVSTINYLKFKDNKFRGSNQPGIQQMAFNYRDLNNLEAVCSSNGSSPSGEYDFVKDPEDQAIIHSFKIDGWSLNYTDADVDSYEGSEEDEGQSEEDPDAQTVVGGSIIATVGQGLTEEDDFQFNGVESRDDHDQLDCFLAPDSNGVFRNWSKTIEFTLDGGDKWFGKAGKFKVTVSVDGDELTEFWNKNTSAAGSDEDDSNDEGSVEGDSNDEGSDETAEQEASQLHIQIELVEPEQPAWEFQDPLIKQTAKFATTLIKYELNRDDSEIFRNIVGDFQLATDEDKAAAASGVNGEDAPPDSEPSGDVPPDDEGGGEGSGEETDPSPKYIVPSFTFQIRIKKSRYSVYLNSIGTAGADGQFDSALSYVFGNTYYDGDAHTVENIIPVTDLIGDSIVGTYTIGDNQLVHYNFGYGYMNYPTNLDTAADFQGLEFMKIFAEISSDNTIQDGYYCPCTVQVINPNQVSSVQGDIYNRYFETEQRVYVDHFSGLTTHNISIDGSKKDVWLDSAATIKSIRGKSTSDRWKLIVNTSDSSGNPTDSEDLFVPSSMRKKVRDLVFETLKFDEAYFKTMLEQFKTFLSTVNSELNQNEAFSTWDSNAIRDICKFKYDAAVTFSKYSGVKDNWNKAGGLFETRDAKYSECLENLQTHLYNEFYNDFQTLSRQTDINIRTRGYNSILVEKLSWDGFNVNYDGQTYPIKDNYTGIYDFRTGVLQALYDARTYAKEDEDLVTAVFGDKELDVRYINRIKTSIFGDILGGVYVADENCHVLANKGSTIGWYKFNSGRGYMDTLLENKRANAESYIFAPQIQQTERQIIADQNATWRFKFANRDLSAVGGSKISDAFVLRCSPSGTTADEMWYLSSLGTYLCAPTGYSIVDIAYEQYDDVVYALFADESGKQDHYLYRFDHLLDRKDSQGRIVMQLESADMKIETFHSVDLTNKELKYDSIYLDYDNGGDSWVIRLYGQFGDALHDVELWNGNPGQSESDYQQYNCLLFGDTLFSSDQLKFQNISKNKEMFDILDINEVDGCYYGLFKDELNSTDEETVYAVFKTAPLYKDARGVERTGVVQRLPYKIVDPSLYRTNGDLYSLYVIEKTADGIRQLREISVPDSEIYGSRTIPLQDLMDGMKKDSDGDLIIHQMIMSEFMVGSSKSSFFVLSNWGEGFHKIYYTNDFNQLSIDVLNGVDNDGNPVGLVDRLLSTFRKKVIGKHMKDKHENVDYFKAVSSKVNQFAENFTTFSLIPTEFYETQDIGVIPDSKVDDTDKASDHRKDSLQVSTDILQTDGMAAGSDANPGLVTAAVSNPATTYDSVYVFLKSQRNPSIEGTEFYDYITDADGNELMNLYAIPFIYRVNTNNTYDLYINIPTTRTKYLNRMAGTLKDDGTTQVQKDDYSTRKNFLDEPMPNNLDESTTKLRVYIDRKFISIGNIELVEISGNSIPLQIYRDSANNGLYDSIALESRWNGEVVELNEPDKDTNKIMLEFECYGTDSQSIHIQGKTLINHVLNDKRYRFA